MTVKTWFEEGVEAGQRKLLLVQLEEQFGPLSDTVRQRLEAWPGKHLIGLGGEIILADDIAGHVKRGLAGDEDDAAAADLDHLRITRRGAEFGRIDADDFGRCVACHAVSPMDQLRGPATAGGAMFVAFFGFSVPA